MLVVVAFLSLSPSPLSAQSDKIDTAAFDKEVNDFFTQEMAAHLNEIKTYNPAPNKVFAAATTGEYTWGSFMNSLGAYAAMSERTKLGDRDLAQ